MPGLIGKKVGMTRIFDDDGVQVPVTVIEAGPCAVVQIRSLERDGYRAAQVGYGTKSAKRITLAERGHAAKAGLEGAPRLLREIALGEGEELEVGQQLTVEQFAAGDRVKVTGRSKGRGFQGVVKRHGFGGRPGSHGHPEARNPGSIGPGTDPSRVIKGKRLPGRMGGARTTIRNLEVVRVDGERNLLFLKGGVPGARNGYVLITK
ncbi:MAG TPA: 50S ribosomal protein L3 [Longimicrobiales bacterium]|nr:50S ribosomal protein L3 [Longimicrobiales bacterium]